ncbi:MAG: hypothetical protein GAK30_00194 [Paracidovorax wautersii]|uniref:HTH gntR-type domain-containing protein n=1 Tax=Paracidovorax wautersii TaxID=1177982 RepID=A0A7V8JRS5_9BURK|nr:MAG: hypothetical protein GAK30_00194 [Paracidovorax wautersii]
MNRAAPLHADFDLPDAATDDHIREAIYDAILDHKLPAGTRLVEAPLCEAFGVTRPILRRVFLRLSHERVIELQPNRGASVAAPSLQEANHVFEARRIVEQGVVAELARRAQRGELGRALAPLRTLIKEEHRVRESGSWKRWIRLSGDFHIQLAAAHCNDEITHLLTSLVARSSLMIGLYEAPSHTACSADEHTAILDAIEAGENDRAAHLMAEHIGDYAARLLRAESPEAEVDLRSLFAGSSGRKKK